MKNSLLTRLNNYWDVLEKKSLPPKYVSKIIDLEFLDLKKNINHQNEKFLKKIIKKMYIDREAFILKKCATKNLKQVMLDIANKYNILTIIEH